MTKKERAQHVLSELSRLYPDPEPPLHFGSLYQLLIAVLLSAQCTDARVNEVTPILFGRAPDAAAMTALSEEEIYKIIRPCGLAPQKARAILSLSKRLVAEFGGQVPGDLEILESLAGVGHKTASVVMSQGFHVPAFPVDTHIHRLAQRWGFTSGASVTQTERDLKALFPESTWNKLHLQIIYYAREHCPARGCFGLECMICKSLYPRRKTPVETRKA
ncbi:MAG TPA: endonuclease III [Bdellovibrionota bacterium]|jgi:endonuclease-3|nr:endonuclease III [Bdellovibrionota bacterium]